MQSYQQEDIRVGMDLDTFLSDGRIVRGVVREIRVTAHECYAVVETAERHALGARMGRTNLIRSQTSYRCKLDDRDLPICPLANLRCHSPCDIVAMSYGPGYHYPHVVELPDG